MDKDASSKNILRQLANLAATRPGRWQSKLPQRYAQKRLDAHFLGVQGNKAKGQWARAQSQGTLGDIEEPMIPLAEKGRLLKVANMDRELASAVFRRWDDGLPVAETTLYKAAAALGVDPQAALVEARFLTYLGDYLQKHAELDRTHRILFSAAAGLSDQRMEKAAFLHRVDPDELILHALRERDFVPDLAGLAKLANVSGIGGDPTVDGMTPPPDMGDPEQAQAMQAAMGMQAPPQQGQAVQQPPGFKPSPMAPEQLPPSPDGNLESLLQSQQGAYGQGALDNGGLPPAGMPEPPPPPKTPSDRVREVGPSLDDETVQRYAEQLERFESGMNMQVADPKQMVKFVKELQKVDGKRIDQGIKAMGQQLEQEQAQELGVEGTPTIDGTGGAKILPPKPGQSAGSPGAEGGGPPGEEEEGAEDQGGPPGPPQAAGGKPGGPPGFGGPGGPGGLPGKPKPKQPPMVEAAEKVAQAARAMAHSRFR